MPKATPVFVTSRTIRREGCSDAAMTEKADDTKVFSRSEAGDARGFDSLPGSEILDTWKLWQSPTQSGGPRDSSGIAPWLENIAEREYAASYERLHDEIVAFASWASPTPEEEMANQSILLCISHLMNGHAREGIRHEVKLYGSFETGLSLPSSDINVEYVRGNYQGKLKNLMGKVNTALVASGLTTQTRSGVFRPSGWKDASAIHLITQPTLGDITVRITKQSDACQRSTDETKAFVADMPALRPLVLVLKSFLRQRALNNVVHGLSSYSVVRLCVRFLQRNPGKRAREFIEDPMNARSLGVLLCDLFFFYGFQDLETVFNAQTHDRSLVVERDTVQLQKASALGETVLSREEVTAHILKCFQSAWVTLSEKKLSALNNILGPIVGLNEEVVHSRHKIRTVVRSGELDRVADWSEKQYQKSTARPRNHMFDGPTTLPFEEIQAPATGPVSQGQDSAQGQPVKKRWRYDRRRSKKHRIREREEADALARASERVTVAWTADPLPPDPIAAGEWDCDVGMQGVDAMLL